MQCAVTNVTERSTYKKRMPAGFTPPCRLKRGEDVQTLLSRWKPKTQTCAKGLLRL
jgi:hypothetical protein